MFLRIHYVSGKAPNRRLNVLRDRVAQNTHSTMYRVRQKHLTIWQHSCEWNRCHGEFVLERPSSETQSISVAMER